jgi:hypothetical protein
MMKSIRANLMIRAVAAFALAIAWALPAFAADIPDDDAQDVLIRTALLTFNDANMTNNYAVMLARSSKQFQSQFTADKMATAFEAFRTKKLFFEEVATDEYDSSEDAKIDKEGALVLAGVFKSDELQIKYNLRFVKNDDAWKLLGINVDATRKKQ